MAPQRRPQYTQENIEQQLQQIHLLDPSSSSENLEQLGPIIKQIHANRQQEVYLRNLQALIATKDSEIEQICTDNYQEFISSASTLFTVKSYTTNLREKITTLDASVSQVGRSLVEKKRSLLQSKKTAANLDEAIDTLQACLKVLDVYWSALRSLEDIQSLPSNSLSQTPFYQHLLSSLPSLRIQIQNAVTASMKQWLLEIRNVSGLVGKLALEVMDLRTRKWRSRREKDPMLRLSRVGSAVEMVTQERSDTNVLDSEKLKVDFTPLYQCIHIYTTLDSIDNLRRSYQADRKAQSDLILPDPLPLASLVSLTQEICGFFIIESHVLETTGNFRSEREVEELWEALVSRLSPDPDSFLRVKECLIGFVTTLESYSYATQSLHSLVLMLFEKYAGLLEGQFSRRFDDIILQDDHLPMQVTTSSERDSVLAVVWLGPSEQEALAKSALPLSLPWSQGFYQCCEDIRNFIQKFYHFVDGVSQHHGNIDELLNKSLDKLLSNHISESICKRLSSTSTLTQVAQIVSNLEHFEVACAELERSLTSLRSTQRGGAIRLSSSSSFADTVTPALNRVTGLITSKLDDFFDLAEYDWAPQSRDDTPSMYLYELINWLTTVVDSLVIEEVYKDEAYRGAVGYIAECLMNFMVGPNVPAMNENAISNILVDTDFLEGEFARIGRGHLNSVFAELRSMVSIVLNDAVQDYLVPQVRQTTYSVVRPKRLQTLLEKLSRHGASRRDARSRERGEKRRKEADAVGRVFPGENR
ncbi:exocyst complex subunit Sec15-like-domain-containing protein [Suillus paluster]|uniref:exocyst complex subunit Sec15-like-domain-containing protein n=1 Tax=Suillus paluster TaxID=48578 RepID=UPI001B862997|nr:exocyst complex subunit Sec15-like-domain-containing protein [Suillus paluster]KAG1752614.1 exocyst complex subunit Sec15-like-domain-containing protein [Suillus paluster]